MLRFRQHRPARGRHGRHSRQQRGYGTLMVRRVQQHKIEPFPACGQIHLCGRFRHAGFFKQAGGLQVLPHHRTGLPAAVDKHTARSAAAERLDAKLARTRKQVQHTSARQKELDGAEHALLDTVHRGPCDLFTGQRGQPCAARGTGNNAHLILLIRTGGLAAAPHILSFRLLRPLRGQVRDKP